MEWVILAAVVGALLVLILWDKFTDPQWLLSSTPNPEFCNGHFRQEWVLDMSRRMMKWYDDAVGDFNKWGADLNINLKPDTSTVDVVGVDGKFHDESPDEDIEPVGSGNIYEDLGLEPSEKVEQVRQTQDVILRGRDTIQKFHDILDKLESEGWELFEHQSEYYKNGKVKTYTLSFERFIEVE